MKPIPEKTECEKYGARVYQYGKTILVKQTVRKGVPPEYVIDRQREAHVAASDAAGIANAVQKALKGILKA